MRLALSISAALLVTAIFAPSVRAQASIPYRRTIPYLSNRPYQFTGRYVRISANIGPQTLSFGRSGISMTVQSTINVPVSGITLTNGNGSAGEAGNERPRRAGAGGP
jgi:hypothetical protein